MEEFACCQNCVARAVLTECGRRGRSEQREVKGPFRGRDTLGRRAGSGIGPHKFVPCREPAVS